MRTCFEKSRKPEVGKSRRLSLKQDICGLEIAVNDLPRMQMLKTGEYSARHHCGSFDCRCCSAVLLQPCFKRAVRSIFADDDYLPVVDVGFNDRQHVRVARKPRPQ